MRPFIRLLRKDIRDIFLSKTTVLFLVIASFIIGYGFRTAVMLYGHASKSALDNPLYAAGFEPVPGVFSPAIGGIFILFSLFLPFVVIPSVVLEKERNTLIILLQIPFSVSEIILSKFLSAVMFILGVLMFMVPAVFIWKYLGGHIPPAELVLLAAGYFLYGLFVVSVSLFSATLMKNTPGASILAVSMITVSWIIDFGRDMGFSSLTAALSRWTTTRMLKLFEQGIFSSTAVVYFLTACIAFMVLSRCFLDVELQFRWSMITVAVLLTGILLMMFAPFNADMTESHRNSFPPAVTRALKKIPPLEIDVYLNPTDSRFKDYEKSFLERLKLVKRDVTVRMMTGERLDRDYGRFVYHIRGQSAFTFSNSEEEIFPLIFGLAGIPEPSVKNVETFPGYPLVPDTRRLSIVSFTYYILIPSMAMLFWIARRIWPERRFNS